jgi:ankyrin repeat protein
MKNITTLFILLPLLFQLTISAQDFDKLADAVYNKDIVKINELLDGGTEINSTPEDYSSTVLFIACSFEGYEEIVSLLISRGADVNFKGKDGRTPLMWAAGNSLQTTQLLIDSGANVKAKGDDGMNAFIQATFGILSGKVTTEVLGLLKSKGAKVNSSLSGKSASGWSALLFATVNGDKDLVEYLIHNGANVNHTSDEGQTALALAKQEKYEEIVRLLKKHGALD